MSSPVAASAVAARRFAAARPSLPWVATGLWPAGSVLVTEIALVVVPARRTAGTPPR